MNRTDLERLIELHDLVSTSFLSKRPLEVNERVYAPSVTPYNSWLLVTAVDGNWVELLMPGTDISPARTFTLPQWKVCRAESAMRILHHFCKEVINFEAKPE